MHSTIFVEFGCVISTKIGDMGNVSSSSKSLFGRRMREARLRRGIAQDRLGVMIGLDEGCSSARISRYENGVHEPPFQLVNQISKVLGVASAYFYCADDRLAEIIRIYSASPDKKRDAMSKYAAGLVD